MTLTRRTYALPSETLKRFEREVSPSKRSAKVAELIENWVREREREVLRQNIIEGCREMWDVYLETAQEWEPLDAQLVKWSGTSSPKEREKSVFWRITFRFARTII
ncbi:MAG TPA: hypothetical protein VKU00_08140 [Chthonomonadaceae bacterium]|nr:hypothetical protein [Chthonomonadaceae bacterium]